MAEVSAGVYSQAQLNAGMSGVNGNGMGSSPTSWSYIWFGAAVMFIIFVYMGFGGHRGSVAS